MKNLWRWGVIRVLLGKTESEWLHHKLLCHASHCFHTCETHADKIKAEKIARAIAPHKYKTK